MIKVDLTGGLPIYEQICKEISGMIGRGELMEGDKLPGARVLAKSLSLNPNTVAKAYSRLEHDEIIFSVAGKGCFVAKQKGSIEKKLTEEFVKKATEALAVGIDAQTLIGEIRKIDDEMRKKND